MKTSSEQLKPSLLSTPPAQACTSLCQNAKSCGLLPPVSVPHLYPKELNQKYNEGTLVPNAPIDSENFTTQQFTTQVQSLEPFFDVIIDLDDTQIAF